MDAIDELKAIQYAINLSSEHTKRQLDSIDPHLYAGAILSYFLAIGLTYFLELSPYWIPAGFLLIIGWALFSIIKMKKVETPQFEQNIGKIVAAGPERFNYQFEYILKLVLPFGKSLAIIFGISMVFIIIQTPTWFDYNNFWSYLPIIACILWILAPFAGGSVIRSQIFHKIFQAMMTRDVDLRHSLSIFLISKFIFAIILFVGLMILPIVSLFVVILSYHQIWSTITIPVLGISIPWLAIADNWTHISFLFLVLAFQVIAVFLAAGYFSALSVKKELINSISQYARLNQIISYFIVKKNSSKEDIISLQNSYLLIKRYDMIIDESFQFVFFYVLQPQPAFLKTFDEVLRIEERKKRELY